ncbi:hypothetical protein NFI96_028564 [Prochilodus magdalenae]|nr:hypothetical protein NFI96_028564 [Prochilodus magdalenae]
MDNGFLVLWRTHRPSTTTRRACPRCWRATTRGRLLVGIRFHVWKRTISLWSRY